MRWWRLNRLKKLSLKKKLNKKKKKQHETELQTSLDKFYNYLIKSDKYKQYNYTNISEVSTYFENIRKHIDHFEKTEKIETKGVIC